jgi:hypothetical protein
LIQNQRISKLALIQVVIEEISLKITTIHVATSFEIKIDKDWLENPKNTAPLRKCLYIENDIPSMEVVAPIMSAVT